MTTAKIAAPLALVLVPLTAFASQPPATYTACQDINSINQKLNDITFAPMWAGGTIRGRARRQGGELAPLIRGASRSMQRANR